MIVGSGTLKSKDKIKYKYIEHERTEDAPFVGALVVAPSCKLKCKNCFNRDLKKRGDIENTAEEIVAMIKENPFNEGIILAGLEWSESPRQLVALLEEASKQGLKIMIYTGCEIQEFHERIGRSCADKVGFKMLNLPKFLQENDKQLYQYVGASVLDYYIPADYYIKAGRYDETQKVEDRVHFGVRLATANQNIYLIKKEGANDEAESK